MNINLFKENSFTRYSSIIKNDCTWTGKIFTKKYFISHKLFDSIETEKRRNIGYNLNKIIIIIINK